MHTYNIRMYAHAAADEMLTETLHMGDLAEKKTLASSLRNAAWPATRRSSFKWISSRLLGGGRAADVPKITRVWFSWDDHVTEYDPSECPHTVNPQPYLEMTTAEDEQGRKVEKYMFAYTPSDEDSLQVLPSALRHSPGQQLNNRRVALHFDNANPRWSEHADGVRSRLLCVRYNRAKSSLDGAFFIENRTSLDIMSACNNTPTTFIRYTADNWATSADSLCDSTCLASDDYVHRFSLPLRGDLPADSAVALCLSFNIGNRQHWDSNGGGNYTATFH